MADLLPLLGDGLVLELGCGNGKLLHPLRSAGVDVVGLDVSWHALGRLGDGDRVLADAAVLPFRDGAFTAVLDVHCTGHLDRSGRVAAWREAHRVLRPGGILVAERLAEDDLRAGQGTPVPDDPGTRRLQDGRTTHFARRDALVQAAEAAGFTVISVVTETRHPRLRGVPVTRSTHRLVLRR